MNPVAGCRKVGATLLDLLFPVSCAGCAAAEGIRKESMLCAGCENDLVLAAGPRCPRCGESLRDLGEGGAPCSNCAGRDLGFDYAVAKFRARGLAREIVHRFKYRKEFHLCRPLGWMLGRSLEDERIKGDDWVMVPVPLHPRRLREREFNQAAEICRVASRKQGRTMIEALVRTRDTMHQARLDRSNRLENLADAFALKRSRRISDRLAGARVILVDDVFTTGATASECARVLKQRGNVCEVVVATAMRG